jgi:hypothetical protein
VATVYRLSYTLQEIDEKLGKIDDDFRISDNFDETSHQAPSMIAVTEYISEKLTDALFIDSEVLI